MSATNQPTSTSNNKSLELCIKEYFNTCNSLSEEELKTKTFWRKHQKLWPEFASLAKLILSIPATSAPVERIFSVGGAYYAQHAEN